MPPLARQLAAYAAGLTFENLSSETVHEVKRHLLDGLGCALGAWQSDVARIVLGAALADGTGGGATLLGLREKRSLPLATFVNGCLVHYLAFNDTYLAQEPAHPSDNIPACLSAAEAAGASGQELILAVALAYEVQCRFCDAAALRRRGWDHSTYLAFSAVLGAGRLLGLTEDQLYHAVNIAASQSAVLRQARVGQLSPWKSCVGANSTRTAIFAASLARRGMEGPEEIFEGRTGFAAQVTGPFDPDVEGWGDPTMICRTSLKFWPGAYHAQSAIEAALWIHDELGPDVEIEGVRIVSFDAAVEIMGSEPAKWAPNSRETADHSLPYLVAAALLDGQLTPDQLAPERIRREDIRALLQKVRIQRDPGLSARYPAAVANRVEVCLRSGRVVAREVVQPKGHPRNPMTDLQIEEKFRRLSSAVLTAEQAGRLIAAVWNLEQQTAAVLMDLAQVSPDAAARSDLFSAQ